MNGELCIGVDLGGTKVEGIVLRTGAGDATEVLVRRRVPTERERGYAAVLETTRALVVEVAAVAGCDMATVPIGVGMPGHVTRRDGLVKNSNTTCLNGRPFRHDLGRLLGRPVCFDNDANCFALAEARLGAARGHAHGAVLGVILGTGVGGGVVFGGRVWSGAQGIAGEWGHHAVYALPPPAAARAELRPCYCGQRGCLEAYVSGPAVERDYAARAGAPLGLDEIARRRHDDPHAAAAISLLLDAFARGLANVIDVLDPSIVVLGGGVSHLDLLYDEGARRVAAYVFNDELTTPIVRNQLGDSAGVFGAALLGASSDSAGGELQGMAGAR